MGKSIAQQSSIVCTSVFSSMGIEKFLPHKEQHKLHGHSDFLRWILFFVGNARCAGYWETLNDTSVELVDPSNMTMNATGSEVIMTAQSFLENGLVMNVLQFWTKPTTLLPLRPIFSLSSQSTTPPER
jgi:hypothetical protein